MTKTRFLLILISTLATFLASPLRVHAQQDGSIVAVVNTDVISALDLHTRVTMTIGSSGMPDTPKTRARIAPQILRNLINEKLMLQEARRVGIKVDDKKITAGLARIAANNKITLAQLENRLKRTSVPLSALKARVKAEIAWRLFVVRKLKRKLSVGEEEISDEIKRIQSNAGKPEYLLAEIYLPVEKQEQNANVRSLAMRLLQQLKAGTAFQALARNFSRASSAAIGGDLGWIQVSHLDDALRKAVLRLRPGSVSMPVRALGGYYLIFVRDERKSPGLPKSDALLKLSQLHMRTTQAKTPEIMNALAAKLTAMTRNVRSCAQFEALAPKTKSPLSGPMGEISLSAMPEAMRTVLASLKTGQISRPIPTGGGVAVMMVCHRQDKKVDMNSIRKSIKNRLLGERLDIAAQRHLRDLRRDAFVDIRL